MQNLTETQNYRQEELTIDAVKANINAVLVTLPIAIIMLIAYYLMWSEKFTKSHLIAASKYYLPLMGYISAGMFIFLILGIVVHELIHGFTWSLFAKRGFRSIRFGIIWKALTPYCHCNEPLRAGQYIIGALMPAIIVGFVPLLIGLFAGHVGVFLFGLLFTMAAGGDFLIVHMLRNENGNTLVQDHPSKIGCFVFRELDKSS